MEALGDTELAIRRSGEPAMWSKMRSRWTITLREGLVFHDGEKVRAQDAVASIGRWMKRNTFGQKLEASRTNCRLR